MPLWTIYRYDPKTRAREVLGRVRAKNQPRAVLNGLAKFKIKGLYQRRIGAEPVIKPKVEPLNISDEDRAALRNLTQAFRGLMHKHL